MRIGIDGCSWANVRGYGRFTREVCRAMLQSAARDDFVFFLDAASAECFDLQAPNVELVRVNQRVSATEASRDDGSRHIRDMLALTRAVRRHRPDVLFFPSVYTFFPVPHRVPGLVCIHDAIPERFPRLVLPSLKARFLWKAKVRLALAQTKGVLTVSEHAAEEISRCLRVPRSKITVAVEAPAPVFRPSDSRDEIDAAARRAGLPAGASWFIYVGGFSKHKNVDSVARAHASVADEIRKQRGAAATESVPHLLLVGPTHLDSFHVDIDRVRRVIEEVGTGDLVHWPGFVPDEELRHLHSGAIGLVMPSECEGFGLPAVEAAACGIPVVTTTESPLPQLLEGGGFFVDPGDQAGLLAAMLRLATDEDMRQRLASVAHSRAAALSWDKAAAATLRALRAVARPEPAPVPD